MKVSGSALFFLNAHERVKLMNPDTFFFFHDYIYELMQNAKRSSERGAISDCGVSGRPVQTGFHYVTLSIIHFGSGSVPLVSSLGQMLLGG